MLTYHFCKHLGYLRSCSSSSMSHACSIDEHKIIITHARIYLRASTGLPRIIVLRHSIKLNIFRNLACIHWLGSWDPLFPRSSSDNTSCCCRAGMHESLVNVDHLQSANLFSSPYLHSMTQAPRLRSIDYSHRLASIYINITEIQPLCFCSQFTVFILPPRSVSMVQ